MKRTIAKRHYKVTIDETFTNSGIDLPFEKSCITIREGRVTLYEGEDYFISHYRLYFTENFLNNCSIGNTITIDIKS